MITAHKAALLSAASMLLIGVAGCGGGGTKTIIQQAPPPPETVTQTTPPPTTQVYKDGATRAGNTFKASAQAASQQVQAAPDTAGKIAGLEALKASVNTAADDFSTLSPPPAVQADNDALVAGLRSLAGDVDNVERALKTSDATAARAALPKLQTDEARITKTIADLQATLGG